MSHQLLTFLGQKEKWLFLLVLELVLVPHPLCVCACVFSLTMDYSLKNRQADSHNSRQTSSNKTPPSAPPVLYHWLKDRLVFFFALISVPLTPDCREAEWKWWHPYVPTGTFGKVPKCKGNEREEVNVDQSEAEVKGVDLWGAADEDVLTGEQHQTARLSSLCH